MRDAPSNLWITFVLIVIVLLAGFGAQSLSRHLAVFQLQSFLAS